MALRLSEGLGSAALDMRWRWACQGPVIPGGLPRAIPAPRRWPWCAVHSSRRDRGPIADGQRWLRRPDELTEIQCFRRGWAWRFGTAGPCHCCSGAAPLMIKPFFDWRMKLMPCLSVRPHSTNVRCRIRCCDWLAVRGFAALWLFSSRRQALTLLEHCTAGPALPNVRAKRATTAGRQARAGENVPRTARPGLAACRWRSA